MLQGPPPLVAINHDDYHAEYVGCMLDGRQFFLNYPFEPAIRGSSGREFVALFLFDEYGKLIEAKIDDFGPRAAMDKEGCRSLVDERLQELGAVRFERIEVAPFSIDRYATTFGLIPRPPEQEGDSWWVELLPGNCMAFHEPWDSGEYDT